MNGINKVCTVLLVIIPIVAPSLAKAETPLPDFGREILPILSNNCFLCHGPDEGTREANLRLDRSEDARKVFGTSAVDSKFMARITAHDPLDIMPPPETGKTLSEDEIEKLRTWIDGGAPYEKHWAFVPPARAAAPAVDNAAWPRNEIDAFILAKIEETGLNPAPEADPITLLRRVHLDLTGIPPTPEEVDSFLKDKADDAYERVVDRLLASPHFGERWGRHWLDGARYADSHGYSIDGPRSIWPYRDWVIQAINADMPFDQFVIDQMAGDLIPDGTRDQKVATGFHRNTMINQEGGVDLEEFRIESLFDRVETTGTVMLGLTMNCVRCHTHKYDPIEHDEYFRMMAFFNQDDEPDLSLPTAEEEEKIAAIRAEINEKQNELNTFTDEHLTTWEDEQTVAFLHSLDEAERLLLATPRDQRTEEQSKRARDLFQTRNRDARRFGSAIRRLETDMPNAPTTMVLASRKEPRETHLLIGGDFTNHGEAVAPGVPAILHPLPEGASTRLDFAQWLMDPANPLTARVTINRFWQRLFGRGIVETEDDFGVQSIPPTHPELLDWLALEFVERGWPVKEMLKLMVTSATYRQSSHDRPDLRDVDPRNTLLAKQNRIRLDAEIVRDNALAASGLLHPVIGGPSVHPPIPDGVMNLGQSARAWEADTDENRYRRGMYTYFWRATPHPALVVFDAPDAQSACTRRADSNTPLQALTLLNDEAFYEFAEALADRLEQFPASEEEAKLQHVFRLCLGREPDANEAAILLQLLEEERAAADERAAWVSVARTMLNLDEFITRE